MSADFFDRIKAMVPHLTPIEASELLNNFEVALIDKTPGFLELSGDEQNAIVLREFQKSSHAKIH